QGLEGPVLAGAGGSQWCAEALPQVEQEPAFRGPGIAPRVPGRNQTSFASSVISGTPRSAFDNGQFSFASLAIFWKVASSTPGTEAFSVSAMRSIAKPLPCLTRRTAAVVSIDFVAMPCASQANENAIVKHAAWAAPRISSGLVPLRSSPKRLPKP